LFGCNSAGPLSYLGDAGLSWFVAGGKLVRLDRQYAVIAINGTEQVSIGVPLRTESRCRGGCGRGRACRLLRMGHLWEWPRPRASTRSQMWARRKAEHRCPTPWAPTRPPAHHPLRLQVLVPGAIQAPVARLGGPSPHTLPSWSWALAPMQYPRRIRSAAAMRCRVAGTGPRFTKIGRASGDSLVPFPWSALHVPGEALCPAV
jgi:hypothetical protein